VNAYQAELFNRLVARRLGRLFDPGDILAGELVALHHNGAFSAVEEPSLKVAQARGQG
jgi:hypothetical protein